MDSFNVGCKVGCHKGAVDRESRTDGADPRPGLHGDNERPFNGVAAPKFTMASDTYMTAVVPAGATSGAVVVTTLTGALTSNKSFLVAK